MEIKSIAILGNTLESRLLAMSLAINNENIDIKIFTNNEPLSNHIKTPIVNKFNYSSSTLNGFLYDLQIDIRSIFENTKTTSNLAFKFNGISDNDIIIPFNISEKFIKDVLEDNSTLKEIPLYDKIRNFLEWNCLKNNSLLKLTYFPIDAYNANKEDNFYYYNAEKKENQEDVLNIAELEFDNLYTAASHLLDIDKFTEFIDIICRNLDNVTWIEEPINEFIISDKKEYYNTKLIKNIIQIQCDSLFDVDFVIDTGTNIDFINNFIEDENDESIIIPNETLPFTVLKEYESLTKEPPTVINYDVTDNGIKIHLPYRDKTIIHEYLISDQSIDTEQNHTTTSLESNYYKKYIINQKYNSNFISLNLNHMGMNCILGEELKCIISLSKYINYTINSMVIDDYNCFDYLNAFEKSWKVMKFESDSLFHYIVSDVLLNEPSEEIKNKFNNWNNSFPKLDFFSITEHFVMNKNNEPVMQENHSYNEFLYAIIAQQKNKITQFNLELNKFDNDFNNIYNMIYNSIQYYLYTKNELLSYDDFIKTKKLVLKPYCLWSNKINDELKIFNNGTT